MPHEFCALVNFNFIIIYIIHEFFVLHKKQLNYFKNSIFTCFFKGYNRLIFVKKNFFFTICKGENF